MKIRKQQTTKIVQSCQYVIIDTDAGGDDAQAIIYAIHQAKKSNKKIIGITCVNGNTYVDQIAKNVNLILNLCNYPVPIFKGCTESLLGDSQKDFYFSPDGLGNKQQKYIHKQKHQNIWHQNIDNSMSAAEFIVESAHKYKKNLGIIAIGPLTNVALAYLLCPEITNQISVLSIMGGSFTGLGIRHFFSAQFNFFLDPQSVKIVMKEFNNVYLAVFDMVLQFNPDKFKHLFMDKQTSKGLFLHEAYEQIMKKQSPLICDPVACIPIFQPDLIKSFYQVSAQVSTLGSRTKGAIFFDWNCTSKSEHKIKIISKIDLQGFTKSIQESYKD